MCKIKEYPQSTESTDSNWIGKYLLIVNRIRRRAIATPKELAVEAARIASIPRYDPNMEKGNILIAPHELAEVATSLGMESLQTV